MASGRASDLFGTEEDKAESGAGARFDDPVVRLDDFFDELKRAAGSAGDAEAFEQRHKPPYAAPVDAESLQRLLAFEVQKVERVEKFQRTKVYKFLACVAAQIYNPNLDLLVDHTSLGSGRDRTAVSVLNRAGTASMGRAIPSRGVPAFEAAETVQRMTGRPGSSMVGGDLPVDMRESLGLSGKDFPDNYAVLVALNSLRKNENIRPSVDEYLKERGMYYALAWVEQPEALGVLQITPMIWGDMSEAHRMLKEKLPGSIGKATLDDLVNDDSVSTQFAVIVGCLHNIARFNAGIRPSMQISIKAVYSKMDRTVENFRTYEWNHRKRMFEKKSKGIARQGFRTRGYPCPNPSYGYRSRKNPLHFLY